MAALTVPLRCAACGNEWKVSPKPDGTMPTTARCPKEHGGCGKLRKVPRAASRPAGAAPATTATWDPPSEPRSSYPVDEPCPHCGEPRVHAEPRGTTRACFACQKRVTPPGVLAPYARGTGVTRTAKSQRERDLEALDLAGRKGVMLGQLRGLAGDERLDPASQLKVEWFAEQVRDATGAARLDELAALFSEAGIRRRRFWQGRAAALTAGCDDEDSDDEDAGYAYAGHADDDDGQGDAAAVVLATPASIAAQQHRAQPQRMTWAVAIAASGWRLGAPTGGCAITDDRTRLRCHGDAARHIGDGWVCATHHAALASLITSDYHRQRQRGA